MEIKQVRDELDLKKKNSYWWLLGFIIMCISAIWIIADSNIRGFDYRKPLTIGIMGLALLIWDLFRDIKKQTKKEIMTKGIVR